MCLGIPGRVVDLPEGYADQIATVDVEGVERRVNIGMLEAPPSPGEWVLIHMGFALEVIDEEGARAALSGLQLVGSGLPSRVRRRFEVQGVVQGVGFRPWVYSIASVLALSGSVSNTGAGVHIEVEGSSEDVEVFAERLRRDTPPLAVVERIVETDVEPLGGTGFTIDSSSEGGPARTLVSPDVATCEECLADLRDTGGRRYRHPFVTCTNCGPRFTIVTQVPYDRPNTTMRDFEMCEACRAEYDDPGNRRFHAQPVACPECGPTLRLVAPGRPDLGTEEALQEARALLGAGKIVAVKGLGGYHLACDATDERAVARLRLRKQRGDKPFAVMVRDLDVAGALVSMDADERALLESVRRPIVLLRRLGQAPVAPSVAPGNPDLGVLLPYTPLHTLLFGLEGDVPSPAALVMTSGNLSGEPIVTDDQEALDRLAPLVDAWLLHDRVIHVPCDDSVSRFVAGAELPLRRSRGYAPLPIALPFEIAPSLAVGADLKNTCAVASGRYAWVSQHVGDMDDLASVDALTHIEGHLEELTGVAPQHLVADAHPGYRSGDWAHQHAQGRPVRQVQHHHAHIASVMGEHGLGPDERCIGIAFDGTGYGTDGAVWGGEVLLCDYKSFRRTAHLAYVPLAGGDASVLRPYRMALAHLRAAEVPWTDDLPPLQACPEQERQVLAHQLDTGFGCVPTSSMGRLFDAVASLAGVRHVVGYEAQAAIELEGLARAAHWTGSYRFPIARGETATLADPGPVVRAIAADVRSGVDPAVIAGRFHTGVAELVADLAALAAAESGLDVVALGGGVFQNAWLLEASEQLLTARGFTVLRPRLLPPNDAGIALGQLLVGAFS